jgi:hypothetical protein
MLISLAFVPLDHLDESFSALVNNFPTEFEEDLLGLAAWFETYYLGRMVLGKRLNPRFPPAMW